MTAELSIELAEAVLYADDGAAEVIKDFKSGTLSLGVDDIGIEAASDLTGAVADDNGVLISASENSGKPCFTIRNCVVCHCGRVATYPAKTSSTQ